MQSPSAQAKEAVSICDWLITQEQVTDAVVSASGYVALPEAQLALLNTPEENRILYTTHWVLENQQPYEYVDEIFIAKGRSEFVLKRFRFSPRDADTVNLEVATMPAEHGFTGRMNDEFTQFVDAINDVILITKAEPLHDEGPRVLFVNDAFERMTEHSANDIIGQTPRILQGAETQESAKQQMRDAFANWQQTTCQLDNYTKSGKHFIVELHITPLQDAIGWWTHWISLQRDVTKRLDDEQKLLKQEALLLRKSRLLRIGEISSNIFHEVRNPLTILLGHLNLLADRIEAGALSTDEIKNSIAKMLDAGTRIEDILSGIRKLSRNSKQELTKQFNVSTEVERLVELVAQLYAGSGIELELTGTDQVLTVAGHPDKFQQIILNLLSNAKDATLDSNHRGRKWIKLSLKREAGNCLIVVQNSGGCIAREQAESIFQPFYTTKSSDAGTGLGLSIVRQFAGDMHGSITCNPEFKAGAEFCVSLPLV
ncbi:MAG: two-component system sensor histidine kinase NtrB [Pseudomonadales bacterium]